MVASAGDARARAGTRTELARLWNSSVFQISADRGDEEMVGSLQRRSGRIRGWQQTLGGAGPKRSTRCRVHPLGY
jgi:hypothetical protein